jgi:carbamoyl-phosphate synthase small subunit
MPLSEKDLITDASIPERYQLPVGGPARRIVVVDCGIKQNIIRSLGRRGAELVVVPHLTSAGDVLALKPDGIVISNGPGDPAVLPDLARTVGELVDSGTPMLGICLGHQLIGMSAGATTSRLRFGHHGGNHPVKDLRDGHVHITSQNHEFQVDGESLSADAGFVVSQVNLNDRSVEGLVHQSKPVFSVQYHPEGAPGPQDNQYVFDRFYELVSRGS